MHYVKKVTLTADRIDYWVRRHAIQYWCETQPAQHTANYACLMPSTQLASNEQSLMQTNKSQAPAKATNKRFANESAVCNMTLQQAKSIARHLGLTLRQLRAGGYRVNFRDGNEATAYYTDNLEDAVDTATNMARERVAP